MSGLRELKLVGKVPLRAAPSARASAGDGDVHDASREAGPSAPAPPPPTFSFRRGAGEPSGPGPGNDPAADPDAPSFSPASSLLSSAPTATPMSRQGSASSRYSSDLPTAGTSTGYGHGHGASAPAGVSPVFGVGAEEGDEAGEVHSGDRLGSVEGFMHSVGGERGSQTGRDSPSKMAFDKHSSSVRSFSRPTSPSSSDSRSDSPSLAPPHITRSPSPLLMYAPWTSHHSGAGGMPHSGEDAGPSSLPHLALPRARSPDGFRDYSRSRSRSPVSPRSMSSAWSGHGIPHTAAIGEGFGAHREREGSQGVKSAKKRPLPLDLTRGQGVGVDPELQVHMDEVASARSAKSSDTSLSHEMNDLSLLRNKIRQNLHDRPIGSVSDHSDSGPSEPPLSSSILDDLDPSHTISADELHNLHASGLPHVILDCRSPVAYGQDHLAGSLNVSIPTLIVKRLRKGAGSKPTWATVGSYIAGQDAKRTWDSLDKNAKVVLLGETGRDDVARLLRDVVGDMLEPNGSAQILTGGWGNLHDSSAGLGRRTVSSGSMRPGGSSDFPPPRQSRIGHAPGTAPILAQPSVFIAPPTPPSVVAPRLANQLSMPSLRTRRAQDQLNSGKRLPQLSLNVAPPLPARASTLDPATKKTPKSPGMLTINTGVPNAANPLPSPTSHGFPMTARKSSFGSHPLRSPTTKSFGGNIGIGSSAAPSGSKTLAPLSSLPRWTNQTVENQGQHMIDPSDIPAGGAPGSARPAIAPFLVSTIIPNFLYLGPEILEQREVDELQRLGVKRILNVAIECEDDSGLRLADVFDKYHHIPMRDIVEEVHLGAGIKDAMAFLDDARLRDSPTYVHCKAGKSRSVTIVLAYLIHANAWTLKTAYSFVAERRPGISPNIGFVAELMQYAEVELGLRQRRAGQGDDSGNASDNPTAKVKRVRARDSMPAAAPIWSSSLQNPQPAKLTTPSPATDPKESAGAGLQGQSGEAERKVDEREIRREGTWVQHRRAPKDERLRPSRRVSKAGLETISSPPLSAESTGSARTSSPHPASTFTSKSATPTAPGSAKWI